MRRCSRALVSFMSFIGRSNSQDVSLSTQKDLCVHYMMCGKGTYSLHNVCVCVSRRHLTRTFLHGCILSTFLSYMQNLFTSDIKRAFTYLHLLSFNWIVFFFSTHQTKHSSAFTCVNNSFTVTRRFLYNLYIKWICTFIHQLPIVVTLRVNSSLLLSYMLASA